MKIHLSFISLLSLGLATMGALHAGLPEATDFNGPWSSDSRPSTPGGPGGPGYWVDQSEVSLDGEDAAEGWFGLVRAVDQTWIETTVTGPTTLHFSYRVKDFTDANSVGTFSVYVGAEEKVLSQSTGSGSFDTGWIESFVDIPDGVQPVKWLVGVRNGNSKVRVYLDQVWTSDDARPRITAPSSEIEASYNVPFSWNVPLISASAATVTITNLPPGLSYDSPNGRITGTPASAGRFEATAIATNAGGKHVAKLRFYVAPGNTTIEEGADAPGLTFSQTPGDLMWAGVKGYGHDADNDAVALLFPQPETTIGMGKTLSTTVEGPGKLSFWYQTEAFTNAGDATYIQLVIGGGTPLSLGQAEWTKATVDIPVGVHEVQWSGTRMSGLSLPPWWTPRELNVFLDQIEYIPNQVRGQSTFEAWRQAWNVVGKPLTSDEDGDGLTLLMEYAMGGSPYALNPELAPVISVINGYLTINFKKSSTPTDLIYFVQGSRDLIPNSWTTSSVEVLEEDSLHILARSKKPVTEQPVFYLKVRVLVAF